MYQHLDLTSRHHSQNFYALRCQVVLRGEICSLTDYVTRVDADMSYQSVCHYCSLTTVENIVL